MTEQPTDERTRIREAMDRLLAGQATASNGSLTIAALAAAVLTHQQSQSAPRSQVPDNVVAVRPSKE